MRCISCWLAVGVQEQFLKYYDAVMPYLKTILTQANRKEQRMLRAKAMECISLIGMAVGKDKFRADALQVWLRDMLQGGGLWFKSRSRVHPRIRRLAYPGPSG